VRLQLGIELSRPPPPLTVKVHLLQAKKRLHKEREYQNYRILQVPLSIKSKQLYMKNESFEMSISYFYVSFRVTEDYPVASPLA